MTTSWRRQPAVRPGLALDLRSARARGPRCRGPWRWPRGTHAPSGASVAATESIERDLEAGTPVERPGVVVRSSTQLCGRASRSWANASKPARSSSIHRRRRGHSRSNASCAGSTVGSAALAVTVEAEESSVGPPVDEGVEPRVLGRPARSVSPAAGWARRRRARPRAARRACASPLARRRRASGTAPRPGRRSLRSARPGSGRRRVSRSPSARSASSNKVNCRAGRRRGFVDGGRHQLGHQRPDPRGGRRARAGPTMAASSSAGDMAGMVTVAWLTRAPNGWMAQRDGRRSRPGVCRPPGGGCLRQWRRAPTRRGSGAGLAPTPSVNSSSNWSTTSSSCPRLREEAADHAVDPTAWRPARRQSRPPTIGARATRRQARRPARGTARRRGPWS